VDPLRFFILAAH